MDALIATAALPPAPMPANPAHAGARGPGDFSRALDSAQRAVRREEARRDAPPRQAQPDKPPAQPGTTRTDAARAPARGGDDTAPPDAARVAAGPADERTDAGTADAPATDVASADPGSAPDLAALLPGWPGKVESTAAGAGRSGEPGDLPLAADPRAARSGSARDLPGADAPGLAGLDRALAGEAGRTPAAETLDAVRAAHTAAADAAVAPEVKTLVAGATVLPVAAPGTPPATLAAAAAPAAAADALHQAHVAAAVDTPAFAPALGTTLSLLARDGVQQAQLSLHPAELGPVAVQIAVDGTQARIDFHAAHAATRAALEASLPELAAALRDCGLTLTGGGVFDQSRQRQSEPSSPPHGSRHGDELSEADAPATTAVRPRTRGVVDLIA